LFQVVPQADGTPRPSHMKEVMRARGPSVRPDLGKQAELADAGPGEER
jgi:sulfite reductase (NADPH) hemoprotein beta-component